MAAAAAADVTVLCLGEEAYTEKPGDIVDLSATSGQREPAAALAAAGATLVVVLVEGGRARCTGSLISPTLVHAMVPGPQGGPAIASLLYGEYAPSGRLPITYPKDEATVPHWHRVTQACNGAAGGFLAATTEDCAVEWPFGAGLSYTRFVYSAVTVSEATVRQRLDSPARFDVTVRVTNAGGMAAQHSVLLFLVRSYQLRLTPDAQTLLAFEKVHLAPRQTLVLRFPLSTDDLMYVGSDLLRRLENGEHRFRVGVDGKCEDGVTPQLPSTTRAATPPSCWASVTVTGGGIVPNELPQAAQEMSIIHLYVNHEQLLAGYLRYLPFVIALFCFACGFCTKKAVLCLVRVGNCVLSCPPPSTPAALRGARSTGCGRRSSRRASGRTARTCRCTRTRKTSSWATASRSTSRGDPPTISRARCRTATSTTTASPDPPPSEASPSGGATQFEPARRRRPPHRDRRHGSRRRRACIRTRTTTARPNGR